jgi:hypothetical protein
MCLFGATRPLQFDHVTEFLHSAAERGADIARVHIFLNLQYRPVSWPRPRLRLKQGHSVWVGPRPGVWVRAIVVDTNVASLRPTEGDACTKVDA